MSEKYVARHEKHPRLSPQILDLVRRRTMPFIDSVGLLSRSLSSLLEEAYLQGMKDAVKARGNRP